ncbi:MAG: twin-arginine translocase subunit TatC [Verrucomicrobiaceae bacterium]|nr:twin-arginine translocase subunit TatC [Verrucomicrobiaceae bacterium]
MWQGILKKVFSVRDKVALNLSGEGDAEKPFIEHLEDLRTMFVRIALTLLIATFGTFFFYQELFRAIQMPIIFAGLAKDEAGASQLLQNIDVAGPFMMAINVSLIAAVIISFPLLLIFLLQFILPGLKDTEKKLLWPAIGIGTGLFLTGAAFAYWSVLPAPSPSLTNLPNPSAHVRIGRFRITSRSPLASCSCLVSLSSCR